MQNYLNLDLRCKRRQLTGLVNYWDFRETGPWDVFFPKHISYPVIESFSLDLKFTFYVFKTEFT